MTKAKPCAHRRRAQVEYHAVKIQLGDDGKVIAWGDTPEMKHWAVVVDMRCARCGDLAKFFARKGFGETTERKALARFGVKPAALPAPPNHKEKPAVTVPGTGWPFPCSTRFNPDGTVKEAA